MGTKPLAYTETHVFGSHPWKERFIVFCRIWWESVDGKWSPLLHRAPFCRPACFHDVLVYQMTEDRYSTACPTETQAIRCSIRNHTKHWLYFSAIFFFQWVFGVLLFFFSLSLSMQHFPDLFTYFLCPMISQISHYYKHFPSNMCPFECFKIWKCCLLLISPSTHIMHIGNLAMIKKTLIVMHKANAAVISWDSKPL